MAPTESQILTQTLLPPSSLSTILPLAKFTALFPIALRNSPQILTLYRALQLQRGLDLDAIRENIAAECRRGREQMRELARSRARDARSGQGGVAEASAYVDATGEGEDGGVGLLVGMKGLHSSESLVEAMEDAVLDLQAEIQRLEDEGTEMMERVEEIVDGLQGLQTGGSKVDVDALLNDMQRFRQQIRAGEDNTN